MKTTTLAGILVAAGIGIGALLSSILPEFPGLGVGWTGIGSPDSKKTTVADAKTADDNTEEKGEVSEPPLPVAQPILTSSTGDAVPIPEVVFVVISGRDYWLRDDPEDRLTQKRATLPQVIQAVKDAPGNTNGVKVKILQLNTAKTTALRALKQELEKAKIPREAIRTADEPIDQ